MPHHTVLLLPLAVREVPWQKDPLCTDMENDFPKRRRSKLDGKSADVSEVYVGLTEIPHTVVEWAVDDKLFQGLETLEGSLECQVLNH